jgi:hypothetical protein
MDKQLSQFEKIQILLQEYNSLRSEMIERHTVTYQAIGIIGAAFVGLIALVWNTSIKVKIFAVVGFVVVFTGVVLWINRDVAKAAKRVRELEADINTRAGEPLLKWETEHGGGGGVMKHFVK